MARAIYRYTCARSVRRRPAAGRYGSLSASRMPRRSRKSSRTWRKPQRPKLQGNRRARRGLSADYLTDRDDPPTTWDSDASGAASVTAGLVAGAAEKSAPMDLFTSPSLRQPYVGVFLVSVGTHGAVNCPDFRVTALGDGRVATRWSYACSC